MGTNFYRIPTEEEMQDRKNRLHARIIGLKLDSGLIERGFRYIGDDDDFGRLSPWDEFVDGTYVHLGKRSSGWKFCWNFHHNKFYANKEDLLAFIRSGRVLDEYGESIDTEEFIEMALNWDGVIFDEAYENEQSLKSGYLPHGSKYHDKVIDGLRVSTSTDFC